MPRKRLDVNRTFYIPFILLNIIAGSFAYPLARAFYNHDNVEQAASASSYATAYRNEYFEILNAAYAATRGRKEGFVIPPPGFYIGKMNMGTDEIPIDVYTITLIFPCYSEMHTSTFKAALNFITEGISELTMKILSFNEKSETTSSSTSIEQELSNLVSEFYYGYLKAQARALGIKPAFLPYEKMSFIFVILVWIRSQSFVETFIKPAINSLQTSILFIYYLKKSTALDLSKYTFLIGVKKSISEEIQKAPNISSEITSAMQKYAQSLTCPALCDTICQKVNNNTECHVECNRELHVKIEAKINSIVSYFYLNDKVIGTYTYNLDLINKILIPGLISSVILQVLSIPEADSILLLKLAYDIEKSIFENVNNLVSKFYKTTDFMIKLNTDSCATAKNTVNFWLNNLENDINQFLISYFNDLNTTFTTATNIAYSTIAKYIDDSIQSMKKILAKAADIETDALEDYITASVFPIYTAFDGVFQAFQYSIHRFDVNVKGGKNLIGNNENILLFDKSNGKNPVTYLPNNGEKFTISIYPSIEDYIFGLLKGAITVLIDKARDLVKAHPEAYILGTLISEGLKMVPNVYIISSDMEDSSGKQLLSPARAGIYCLNLTINPVTPVTYAAKLGSIVVKTVDRMKDTAMRVLGNIFGNTVVQYISEKYEKFNSDIQIKEPEVFTFVPYLVLPPYFIMEKARITKSYLSITLRATYDFSALQRLGLSSQTELFLNEKYEEALSKSCEVLKNVINNFFSNVARDITKYGINNQIIGSLIGILVGDFVAFITEPLSSASARLLLGISSVIFPVFNYNVALTLLERLLAQSIAQEYVPITGYKMQNIVPLFSAINAVGLPIDSEGKSTVVIPIESVLSIGFGSLETLPLYVDDRGCGYVVPDSITSFEPIVAPLIPIAMYMDGKLIIRFTTPFINDVKLSYTGMLVSANIVFDDKMVKNLNWDKNIGLWIGLSNLKDWSVIRLQVNEVNVENGCLLGVALLIPYTAEMPIYVNPMRALIVGQGGGSGGPAGNVGSSGDLEGRFAHAGNRWSTIVAQTLPVTALVKPSFPKFSFDFYLTLKI
jgi:hypothetical protein